MNKKLIPTQDTLAEYSTLVKLDERGGRGVKERTKEKRSKEFKDTYTDKINKGMIY